MGMVLKVLFLVCSACQSVLQAVRSPRRLSNLIGTKLMAEHLGVPPAEVADLMSRTGSMIVTIKRLNVKHGRGLRRVSRDAVTYVGSFLANTRLLDPRYHPGEGMTTGRGIRPRHLALIVGGAAVAWLAWRKWGGRDR